MLAVMTGVPWDLDQLPRQMHENPVGDIFGSPPPPRRQRIHKPNDQLDTIAERSRSVPIIQESKSQEVEGFLDSEYVVVEDNVLPKKVQKDQVSALTKMLSALRR
jgi:hypothetical protein